VKSTHFLRIEQSVKRSWHHDNNPPTLTADASFVATPAVQGASPDLREQGACLAALRRIQATTKASRMKGPRWTDRVAVALPSEGAYTRVEGEG
jgi:hypothetical protein